MTGRCARRAMHGPNSSTIPAKPVTFLHALLYRQRVQHSGMRELYGPFHHSTIDAATAVDDALETITYVNHGFATQDAVVYRTNGGTVVGGLSDLNTYYVYKVDNDTIKLATSASNALGAITINLTDGVGANHTLTKTEIF